MNKKIQKIQLFYCTNINNLSLMQTFHPFLRKEEIMRAAEFKFKEDEKMYTLSHTLLNKILSEELNIAPTGLPIIFNQYGKPYLETGHLFFNLSHSRKGFCFVLGYGSEVGTDIEEVNKNINIENVYKSFFTIREQQQIADSVNSLEEFYKIWTRKEAVLKVTGWGLNINPQEVNTHLDIVKLNNFDNQISLKSYKFNNFYISIAAFSNFVVYFHEIECINYANLFHN